MTPEVEALISKARRSLDNARRSLAAGDADFAASRAYYAMFYAAEALLLTRGLVFSKHAAVISEFSREFVRTGRLPEAQAAALRIAFEERLVADYQFREQFPAPRAKALIDSSEAFLTIALSFLEGGA